MGPYFKPHSTHPTKPNIEVVGARPLQCGSLTAGETRFLKQQNSQENGAGTDSGEAREANHCGSSLGVSGVGLSPVTSVIVLTFTGNGDYVCFLGRRSAGKVTVPGKGGLQNQGFILQGVYFLNSKSEQVV